MTSIEIAGDYLLVHVEGLDRLWALKSELRIPLTNVVGIERAGDDARGWFHGLRAPGTNIPGVLTAGTFYEREGRVFWDVHDHERAVTIQLRDDRYTKLIVEVEHPDAAIVAVRTALSAASSSR